MLTPLKNALTIASCMVTFAPLLACAAEEQSALIEQSTQVAGQQLLLNGAGISKRLVFKIYTVGLYLRDQRRTTEAVLSSDGPRRLMIRLMRDISTQEFEEAVLEKLAKNTARLDAELIAQMKNLSQSIAHLSTGLHRGDMLTMDWIPGTGTVIEHNQRRIIKPMQDIAFYNALLNIWLGEKAADQDLKTALLGQTPT